MTSTEYKEQLSAALRKIGGTLPLGFEYTRLTGQNAPIGGVDYLGQTATRAMYSDLWVWLNENKPDAIVSESEWQILYASQNGNVAKYSSGDGSTTFRFPRVAIYGNSTHVTPETVTIVMGVIAFGSVASIGEATEEGIVAELGEHGAKFAEYLPLSGGEMSGVIIANRDVISGSELDQAITIKAHAGGPQLNLFGSEYNGDYAGVAELIAQNGTQRSGLGVFPDGRLLGPSGSEVPQYSRWANYAGAWWIGRSNTFTAPGPGWLSVSMVVGNHDWYNTGKFITVNGVAVMRLFAYTGGWAGLCNNMLLPLNTGDVVEGLVQATSDMTLDAWFIPIK